MKFKSKRKRQRDDLHKMNTSYDHNHNECNATFSSRIRNSNSPQYVLCIAIALLAIILLYCGDISLLVQAVEPPSVPSTLENGVSTPVKNSNENNIASTDNIPNDNNEEKDKVVGDQRVEEKIIETIQSSDENVFVEGDKIDVQDDTDNYVNTLLPEPKAKGDNINNLNIHDSKAQKDGGGRRQRRMQRQNRDKEQKHRTDDIDSSEVQQPHHKKSIQADYDAYMSWCEKVLGIKSVVEIQEFEYIDHLQIYWDDNGIDDRLDKFDWLEEYTATETLDEIDNSEELPTKLVRGLAAKHDIQLGDVVISIPLFSLLSIPTTIDHDPVLSRILGPEARIQYGFTEASEYELPLLVLAVLYHRSLGDDSPISHYIDILLETSTDSFPFLWSDKELREMTDDRDEVKNLARGIRQDLHVLYNDVMGTLVRENKEWFGPPVGYNPQQYGANAIDWVYSYENFQWAFALVISRHHYLPISAFDDEESAKSIKRPPTPKLADYPSIMHETLSSANEVVPPANQPTDSWVDEAHNEERVVEDDIIVSTDDDLTSQSSSSSPIKHSFLAPLADLINFGPPCLIGSYNEEEHAFELIAACSFTKGQEVTFWYSSDCSDVIVANFGFLHPLVPKCEAPKDWKEKSMELKEKTKALQRKVDLLRQERTELEGRLSRCENEEDDDQEEKQKVEYAMPTANSPETHQQKLRKDGHHSLRQEVRVRGRMHDQQEITEQMMEELG